MIVALDPGGQHTGVAWSDDVGLGVGESATLDPSGFRDLLGGWLDGRGPRPELVIYEGFRLYPSRAKAMIHSRFETVERIGALLWMCEYLVIPVIEQLATIKQPTEHILKRLGKELGGGSRHAKDAKLHLWHHLLRAEYPGQIIKDLG